MRQDMLGFNRQSQFHDGAGVLSRNNESIVLPDAMHFMTISHGAILGTLKSPSQSAVMKDLKPVFTVRIVPTLIVFGVSAIFRNTICETFFFGIIPGLPAMSL